MKEPTPRRRDNPQVGAPQKFDETQWREGLKAGGITGPWDNEPDREEWRHQGLPCLATRGPLGNWCGYVAVAPGHPAYLKGYDDVEVEVHGGLTYAGPCSGHICHVPRPGETDAVYWLGFDCGHSGDEMPAMIMLRSRLDWPAPPPLRVWPESYKTLEYVKAEVNRLAEQLAYVGRKSSWMRAALDHVRGRVFKLIYNTDLFQKLTRGLGSYRLRRAVARLALVQQAKQTADILHTWTLKIRLRFIERPKK